MALNEFEVNASGEKIRFGPLLDPTDGVTPVAVEANVSLGVDPAFLIKNDRTAQSLSSYTVSNATPTGYGFLVVTAGDLSQGGDLILSIQAPTKYLYVNEKCKVRSKTAPLPKVSADALLDRNLSSHDLTDTFAKAIRDIWAVNTGDDDVTGDQVAFKDVISGVVRLTLSGTATDRRRV